MPKRYTGISPPKSLHSLGCSPNGKRTLSLFGDLGNRLIRCQSCDMRFIFSALTGMNSKDLQYTVQTLQTTSTWMRDYSDAATTTVNQNIQSVRHIFDSRVTSPWASSLRTCTASYGKSSIATVPTVKISRQR